MKRQGFFTSVLTLDEDITQPDISAPQDVPCFDFLTITPKIVEKRSKKLNISKSPGPDKLHPSLYHDLRTVVAKPLSIIFNNSWTTGELPNEWKCANITALFKKCDRKDAGKYRPVSLTCILIYKVMETIVREEMVKHMKVNGTMFCTIYK